MSGAYGPERVGAVTPPRTVGISEIDWSRYAVHPQPGAGTTPGRVFVWCVDCNARGADAATYRVVEHATGMPDIVVSIAQHEQARHRFDKGCGNHPNGDTCSNCHRCHTCHPSDCDGGR